jgi:hypothetical protein
MADIKQELDRIKARISDANFLANKGLSNEVGIHVFKYAPQHELVVRDYIERLVSSPSDDYRVIELDMYKILLEILDEKRVLGAVPQLEEKKGKAYVLAQLQKVATQEAFLAKMKYEPHKRGDVLFLTGIGKVYPFMRSHKMLDSMQQAFSDIPIVMFYPGEFNGQSLILFEKFHDGIRQYRMVGARWISPPLSHDLLFHRRLKSDMVALLWARTTETLSVICAKSQK